MAHSRIFKYRSHIRRILKFDYEIEYKESQNWMFHNKEYTQKLYNDGYSHEAAAKLINSLMQERI